MFLYAFTLNIFLSAFFKEKNQILFLAFYQFNLRFILVRFLSHSSSVPTSYQYFCQALLRLIL